jgi:hypothetical protein
MDSHFCSACGEQHGGSNVAPEVEIARIQAKRDVDVAKIERGALRTEAELAAETEVAVTELETGAAVEVAAELGAPEPAEPETIPVIVDGTPAEPEEPEPTIEPGDSSPPPPSAESRKSKLSYW